MQRIGLILTGLVGLYGFVLSFLVATVIGFNGHSGPEIETVHRIQYLLRAVVAVGAITGCVAAVVVAFNPPVGAALLAVAGIVAAAGLGLVGESWGVVKAPRIKFLLAPVPVILWASGALVLIHRRRQESSGSWTG